MDNSKRIFYSYQIPELTIELNQANFINNTNLV